MNPEFLISSAGLVTQALGLGDNHFIVGSAGRCPTDPGHRTQVEGRFTFLRANRRARAAIIAAHPSTGRGEFGGTPCHIDTRVSMLDLKPRPCQCGSGRPNPGAENGCTAADPFCG